MGRSNECQRWPLSGVSFAWDPGDEDKACHTLAKKLHVHTLTYSFLFLHFILVYVL